MLSYSSDSLRSMDHDRPPRRAVRKTLFSLQLWRPARYRRGRHPVAASRPPTARPTSNVNTARPRSADRSMLIGWLNVQSLTNKSDVVSQLVVDRSLDVLSLTETWHSASDDVRLRLAVPDGYAAVDVARSIGRGGGVAVIFRKHLHCRQLPLPTCTTFEALCVRLTTTSGPVVLLNIYRPGSVRPTANFFTELTSVLELLVVHSCPVIIGGDVNIHVHDQRDNDARRLYDVLTQFDMNQHVSSPTHRCGGTLDLVMTFKDHPVNEVTVDPAGIVSDHSLVTCKLPVAVGNSATAERVVRGWRRVYRDTLRRALEESPLCHPVPVDADVDELFATFDSVLRNIADTLAPRHRLRRRVGRLAPWFDTDCRQARRQSRCCERRYRKTGSPEDRRSWIAATRQRFRLYRAKKEAYWLHRLAAHGRSSPQLWRSLSGMLGRDRDLTGATGHTAEGFAEFFQKKVEDVRAATSGQPAQPVVGSALITLSSFRPCLPSEIYRIIMSSPTKSCSLDPVPTFLIREYLDLLLPYITSMVNASLMQGRMPESQKHAHVVPLLKKPGLDTSDMANFRPVSNVTFMSKVIERAVSKQLNEHLSANDLLPRYQSAYRKHHSTETAMLRILSDALAAADAQQVTLLALLDLSAAFDCVDHSLLLQRLEQKFGLKDDVLRWLTSFITGRSQQVMYDGHLSPVRPVQFGVPQGSVLGPLLFVLYTAEIGDVVANHGFCFHQYADDLQVYVACPITDSSVVAQRLSRCLDDLNAWMSASRLRLNPAKTQLLWLGSRHFVSRVTVQQVHVLSSAVAVVNSARDLGVIVDSELTMADHVAAVCRAGYYQLRQLRPVVRCMTSDAARTLVQAFIASRLDYCNSVLFGVADSLLQRLQSVQNAAARLVTGARRRDHISPILRELHWLPVRRRVEFKVALLVYKALNCLAPAYLVDDCQLLTAESGRRRLRSCDINTCYLPRTKTRFGDRSFAVAGPRSWNKLPETLREPDIELGHFRRLLKQHLF